MASIIPGYNTESKVVTVANNDTDINAAITAQGEENWIVTSITLSGTDIIILFTRTIYI